MTTLAEGARLTGHSGNDCIGTPIALYRWLDRRFKFNYDAAAGHDTAKADTYSTIEGTFRKCYDVPATCTHEPFMCTGRTEIDRMDGLRQTWLNRRVFVNPPYSTALMRAFLEKGIEERNNAEVIVFLVKYDPSTANGRLLDSPYFHLEDAMRVKFDGMTAASTFPARVAIVKPDMWRPAK